MTTNILDVYNHMYAASNQIKGETIDYNRGFTDAVYVLKLALKNYEHINLHIENKKLRRSLFLKELALDDKYEDRHILKNRLKVLTDEIASLRPLTKTVEINSERVNFRLVRLEWDNELVEFYINCDQEHFDKNFEGANKYVSSQYYRKSGRVKKIHSATIKSWFIEYYRACGFICTGK